MSFSELKQNALSQLNGKKKNAALALLVMGIITSIVTKLADTIFPGEEMYDVAEGVTIYSQNPVATIIVAAVSVFLGLGLTSYFLKIVRGEETGIDELFTKGSLFPKAFVSSLLSGVLTAIGCILFIIPGIIISIGYSMINYIYIDNPGVGITEVMKKSREMMKGHKWEFFCLTLSFLGWLILGIFTLGILYFWLIPYMNATYANFYEKIKNGNDIEVKVEAETEE